MKDIKLIKIIPIILIIEVVSIIALEKFIPYEYTLVITNIICIAVILKMGNVTKERIKAEILDFKRKVKWREIFGIYSINLIASMGFTILLSGLMMKFIPEIANEAINESPVATNTMIELLAVSLLIPIYEELFFRGVIFNRLAKKTNVLIGLILSSIIFGILHVELAIVGAIMFGIINTIIYRKYNNIIFPIVVHIINNSILGIITAVTVLSGASTEEEWIITNTLANNMIFAGASIAIVGLILFICYCVKNKKYIKDENSIATSL